MRFSTCCCSIIWIFQKEDEKIHLPSLARLTFQFPGSPSCPAASAPVINIPCLLKGTSQRQRGRRMLLGLKSREGACRGWAGPLQVSHLVTVAGSHPTVILFGSLSCQEVEEGKGRG